jgi:hypothetical protein
MYNYPKSIFLNTPTVKIAQSRQSTNGAIHGIYTNVPEYVRRNIRENFKYGTEITDVVQLTTDTYINDEGNSEFRYLQFGKAITIGKTLPQIQAAIRFSINLQPEARPPLKGCEGTKTHLVVTVNWRD